MQQISRPENRANVASVRVGKIVMDEFTAIPEERLSTGVLWSRLHKPAVSFFYILASFNRRRNSKWTQLGGFVPR
jgi:hypothetical protein